MEKKISKKMKLHQLSKEELERRHLNSLKGGVSACGCCCWGCLCAGDEYVMIYTDRGTTAENGRDSSEYVVAGNDY